MRYIALLRGINVGGKRKVEMKRLKALLGNIGCTGVSTYLNSGNAIFESEEDQEQLSIRVNKELEREFGFEIPTLVKSEKEIKRIADAIPESWQNDKEQKTDVAYLFADVNSEETLAEIPAKREYAEIIYTDGAVVWHVLRKDYNKSQLNKLISRKLYQQMTIRNVNTARFLAGCK